MCRQDNWTNNIYTFLKGTIKCTINKSVLHCHLAGSPVLQRGPTWKRKILVQDQLFYFILCYHDAFSQIKACLINICKKKKKWFQLVFHHRITVGFLGTLILPPCVCCMLYWTCNAQRMGVEGRMAIYRARSAQGPGIGWNFSDHKMTQRKHMISYRNYEN